MGKPIVVKIPPSAPKKTGSAWQQFVTYWGKKYPGFKANAGAILQVAKAEHLDPVVFGALILNESGGNFRTKDSKTGAIGIGQLEPGTFIGPNAWNSGVLPWDSSHKITAADLRNPGINLRLSAAYYGYLQGQYPSDAYGRYSAGPNATDAVAGQIQAQFTKQWITTWNPQYTPNYGTSTAPPSPAGIQVPGGIAPQKPDIPFKDYYVVGVNKQGKFSLGTDPNKAMQYDGAPLTRSSFLTLRDSLTSYYVSYTGQRPSIGQVANYITKGWNPYTLTVLLSHSNNFTKSPIYKQYNANVGASVKDLLPQGAKVPTDLLRQAVVNHWDANTVAAKLRKLPTYTASNEFKGNVATLLNVHDSIMGTPDAQAMVGIKDVSLQGWSSDQYAAWLRSQPAYRSSPEYQTRALGMLSALGLITGGQAVLKQGATPGPGAVLPQMQTLTPDKRVPGAATEPQTPLAGLGATLNG